MRRTPILLLALLLVPLAAAQAPSPAGVRLEAGSDLHAPVGATTAGYVTLTNGLDEPVRLRVSSDLVGAEADAGQTPARLDVRWHEGAEDVLLAPGDTRRVGFDATPHGEGLWHVSVTASELRDDAVTPSTLGVWVTVRTQPVAQESAFSVAGAGAAGAVVALGVFGLTRPSVRGAFLAPFVALYARHRPSEALSHAMRERIFGLVAERPGIAYADLMRATGLGAGILAHHLRVLERAGLVASRRAGARRRLYPAGHPSEAPLPTPEQARVLEALREGATTQRELRERLSLTQQGVSYHLRNLERTGRVVSEPAGVERRWRARDEEPSAGPR